MRSYPIRYNTEVESLTEKGDLPKPIVTDMSLDNYTNPKDITFLTVGTGEMN